MDVKQVYFNPSGSYFSYYSVSRGKLCVSFNLTITIFPSLISLTNLLSLPSHFCTCTSLSPSTVKVDCKHKHGMIWAISGQPTARAHVTLKTTTWLLLSLLWHVGHQAWSRQTPLPVWRRSQCSWRCSGFSPPLCPHPDWWLLLVWWHCPLVLWQNQHLPKKTRNCTFSNELCWILIKTIIYFIYFLYIKWFEPK